MRPPRGGRMPATPRVAGRGPRARAHFKTPERLVSSSLGPICSLSSSPDALHRGAPPRHRAPPPSPPRSGLGRPSPPDCLCPKLRSVPLFSEQASASPRLER
jgi:hypothetical protein